MSLIVSGTPAHAYKRKIRIKNIGILFNLIDNGVSNHHIIFVY
jgi:hypothetical protein